VYKMLTCLLTLCRSISTDSEGASKDISEGRVSRDFSEGRLSWEMSRDTSDYRLVKSEHVGIMSIFLDNNSSKVQYHKKSG
jgi:hypothetical protein